MVRQEWGDTRGIWEFGAGFFCLGSHGEEHAQCSLQVKACNLWFVCRKVTKGWNRVNETHNGLILYDGCPCTAGMCCISYSAEYIH